MTRILMREHHGVTAGDMIMVLQMERSRDVVAKCRLPDVSYWTWLNPTTLALITEKHVFHWNITKSNCGTTAAPHFPTVNL